MRILRACLWLVPALGMLGGCAAVPGPVLANAGVNVAASQSGGFSSGSLQGTYIATFEDAQRAVRSTAEELLYGFRLHTINTWGETTFLIPRNGDSIRVRITVHTPKVVSIGVRVGLFGDQPVSRMMLAQIEQRLMAPPATEAAPDAKPEPEPEPTAVIPQPEPQPLIPPLPDPQPPPDPPR